MIEYTVHFQKGTRVGARSLRMIQVTAETPRAAIKIAKEEMKKSSDLGYRLTRVDHFDETGRIVHD